jgi:S-adenosylmethionine:tRNA ribosyltransferase-isomerase
VADERKYPVERLDYVLPQGLIAQEPIPRRGDSRLLVVGRASGRIEHWCFADLTRFLAAGDILVLNDSRVIPARLRAVRRATGGRAEVLLLKELGAYRFRALVRTRGKPRLGARFVVAGEFECDVAAAQDASGVCEIVFRDERPYESFRAALFAAGEMPTPPYVKRKLRQPERYQTVFAREEGSAAAPTAGLHFEQGTLITLADMGVIVRFVTLHVGIGTFLPIRVHDLSRHVMHAEEYALPEETAADIVRAKAERRRVVAVGTTSVRTLESVFTHAPEGGGREVTMEALRPHLFGETSLFITPGFRFRCVDAMLTNFHLPRSTLLALVYAFGGEALIRRAYEAAIAERYRFYSFGDAMLIL